MAHLSALAGSPRKIIKRSPCRKRANIRYVSYDVWFPPRRLRCLRQATLRIHWSVPGPSPVSIAQHIRQYSTPEDASSAAAIDSKAFGSSPVARTLASPERSDLRNSPAAFLTPKQSQCIVRWSSTFRAEIDRLVISCTGEPRILINFARVQTLGALFPEESVALILRDRVFVKLPLRRHRLVLSGYVQTRSLPRPVGN